MKKGDLSKFIDGAVRAQVFHGKIQDIKSRNTHTDPNALQAVIDDELREVRRSKRAAPAKR